MTTLCCHLFNTEAILPWLGLHGNVNCKGLCIYCVPKGPQLPRHWGQLGERFFFFFFNWNDSGLHNQRFQIT